MDGEIHSLPLLPLSSSRWKHASWIFFNVHESIVATIRPVRREPFKSQAIHSVLLQIRFRKFWKTFRKLFRTMCQRAILEAVRCGRHLIQNCGIPVELRSGRRPHSSKLSIRNLKIYLDCLIRSTHFAYGLQFFPLSKRRFAWSFAVVSPISIKIEASGPVSTCCEWAVEWQIWITNVQMISQSR